MADAVSLGHRTGRGRRCPAAGLRLRRAHRTRTRSCPASTSSPCCRAAASTAPCCPSWKSTSTATSTSTACPSGATSPPASAGSPTSPPRLRRSCSSGAFTAGRRDIAVEDGAAHPRRRAIHQARQGGRLADVLRTPGPGPRPEGHVRHRTRGAGTAPRGPDRHRDRPRRRPAARRPGPLRIPAARLRGPAHHVAAGCSIPARRADPDTMPAHPRISALSP